MITQIFYALVLFPSIKKGEVFLDTDYILIVINESEFGSLELVFQHLDGTKKSVYFTHKDFLKHGDNHLQQINNWYIESDVSVLVEEMINILYIKDVQRDFHFFKNKTFYDLIPFGTVLTITSKCNLFCNYCFNDYDYPLEGRNSRETIGLQKYKNIVDTLYDNGTRDIIITGGEPFTCPFLYELLDYIQLKNIYIRINTNGTLLGDTTKEKLNNNYCLTLMVSMHEFNDKDYFEINALGAKNFGGIQSLQGFEKKFSKKVDDLRTIDKYPNLMLDFLTILTPKNILYLEELYNFTMKNFHIKDWHFFRLYSTGTTKGISKNMIALAIAKIYKLNKQYGSDFKIVDSVPFCVTKNTEMASKVIDGELSENHNVKTIITTDGNIQIMSAFDSNLGSIFDRDIGEVWRGEYVQKMLKNGFLPEECSDCKYKESCRGGSRMDANIYNGSYSAFDPLGDLSNKVVG